MSPTESSQLHLAVQTGNIEVVWTLISQKVNVNEAVPSLHGSTPLHLAVQYCHKDILRLLLKSGATASINTRDHNSRTPLILAIPDLLQQLIHGKRVIDAEVVNILVDAGANVNETCGRYFPLLLAVENNNEQVVKILVDAGARVNEPCENPVDHCSFSLLYLAVARNNEKIVKILIDSGAKDDTSTLLSLAVQNNSEQIVKMLIDAKQDVNSHSKYSESPVSLAATCNHKNTKIIELLINAGAKVHDHLELEQVLDWDDFNAVKILIKAGANVNTRSNNRGWTAFHLAAMNNDTAMINYLLSRGADANIKDHSGLTPLQRAALCNQDDSHLKVIQILLKNVGTGNSLKDSADAKLFQLLFSQLAILSEKVDQKENK